MKTLKLTIRQENILLKRLVSKITNKQTSEKMKSVYLVRLQQLCKVMLKSLPNESFTNTFPTFYEYIKYEKVFKL